MEDGELRGVCEYIEPRVPGSRLRVRWAVESQPEGFAPVGGGVAYVYSKGTEFDSLPVSKDASPTTLGQHRYSWTEGLNAGVPWVMFILILPKGYTLSQPSPELAGARVFQDRVALYWVLRGDDLGRTKVSWTLKPIRTDIRTELRQLNQLLSGAGTRDTTSLAIEDPKPAPGAAMNPAVRRNPWISGSFYLLAVVIIVAALAVLSRTVNPWAFPPILIGGLLLCVIVGALQLRNDEAVKDESFVTLIRETLKRVPLLGGKKESGNWTQPMPFTSASSRLLFAQASGRPPSVFRDCPPCRAS